MGDVCGAPWALGPGLALPLALVYEILAAATYRSDLFARVGFTIWDNGWYAGHALPSYSLISPAPHWESAYLPRGNISIARGWERQLDVRYGALLYEKRLTAAAYRSWLHSNAISYVALPDGHIDEAGKAEARLIEWGLPYLRQVWRAHHWRLFEVEDPTPLVQSPAKLLSLSSDAFAIDAPRPGTYEVRLHWTPYWKPTSGDACVAKASHGYIEVQAHAAGRIAAEVAFALDRIFSQGPRCSADAAP